MDETTCGSCGVSTKWLYCDPCHTSTLEWLLNDKWWLTWRGISKGDLPGETLADTFQRELKALKENC